MLTEWVWVPKGYRYSPVVINQSIQAFVLLFFLFEERNNLHVLTGNHHSLTGKIHTTSETFNSTFPMYKIILKREFRVYQPINFWYKTRCQTPNYKWMKLLNVRGVPQYLIGFTCRTWLSQVKNVQHWAKYISHGSWAMLVEVDFCWSRKFQHHTSYITYDSQDLKLQKDT